MADEQAHGFEAEREVGRINAFFPILPRLGNELAARRPWDGMVLALNLHLTTLTAVLLRELQLGGGTFVVCAASSHTTDQRVVRMLRNQGVEVYTGGDLEDRFAQTLAHQPDLLVDVGFDLLSAAIRHPNGARVRGAVELTRSGITRLRAAGPMPFPVVNINDGRLKEAIENRHGVGEAIWKGVADLTGMYLSGRRLAVVGYGPVGKGLAQHARSSGMAVEVVERNAVRRLFAHYDGFPTPTIEQAIASSSVIVTATGHAGAITLEHLSVARDGLVLVNAGTGGDEIDVKGIQRSAEREDHIAEQVVRYKLPNGSAVTVLGDGHPLNIVLNSGSPEPVLLHFAVLALALESLAGPGAAPNGEMLVPESIERRAAEFALAALALS